MPHDGMKLCHMLDLAQNLFPHTLDGESAMFKMFGRDCIVLGMETMFEPK